MSNENGEAQNETASESEKMDISEVSDQVSPVSDQSPIEKSDNSVPESYAQERLHTLDNASPATAATTKTTNNASSCADSANASRDRLDSALSLEGFDLELPSIETYQEEYVDFPSSPKQLKECLEAHGLTMPLERDSGTMGRSEEEDDEDTSIYQAVLSPDCQDVRLKKEELEGTTNDRLNDTDPERHDNALCNNTIASSTNGPDKPQDISSDDSKPSSRRLLSPNPEDAMLPDLYGTSNSITLLQDPPENDSTQGTLKGSLSQEGNKIIKIHAASDLKSTNELEGEVDLDSGFIFERRNSKRLAKGERVVEGLFVESRLIKDDSNTSATGLRKITLPESLQVEDMMQDENSSPHAEEYEINISDKINKLRSSTYLSPSRAITETLLSNKTEKLQEGDNENNIARLRPVAKARKKLADFGNNNSLKVPPCPKPRRKHVNVTNTVEQKKERPNELLLNPVALEQHAPGRGAPSVNPDGSVDFYQERPGSLVAPQRGGRRRIRLTDDILTGGSGGDTTGDGESSDDSRLSDTDMMSPDDDPDLDALLSPDLDTPDEMEDSIMERLGEPPPEPLPIPELSAAEERDEARSWRSVVVAGLEKRIDMKVIEPYKRVLSHGGYLSAGSHNAIIVFSACFLPDRSRVDYDYVMDNLFLYVLTTLDQLVTEDYVLIYLHGATTRGCMPTFSWLKRCYQMIDRRLRKNLKGLYLVHPTFWLKTIVLMTRPFISSKFSRKLSFVESLAELAEIVPLEQASIPDRVKQYDQIRESLQQGN